MYPLISAGGRFGGVNQCARSEKKKVYPLVVLGDEVDRVTRWWLTLVCLR